MSGSTTALLSKRGELSIRNIGMILFLSLKWASQLPQCVLEDVSESPSVRS